MKTKSNKQFTEEIKRDVGDEYTFLEEYIDAKTPILVRHNKCNRTYKVSPNVFLNKKQRCPHCYQKNKKKTDKQFKEEVYALVGDEYTFFDNYINARTKLRLRHNKCGHVYSVYPSVFLNTDRRCPLCNGGVKKTNEKFKEEILELVGNEYTFIDEYVNSYTKIKVKHNSCGSIFEVSPNEFFQGKRCQNCNSKKK